MFGIGGGEFLVIALVALIAVGPEQLPSVMRKFGGYVGQLRNMADGVRGEFMAGVEELDPVKWTGDGSDTKPIVPRGFAESATTTLGTPAVKPLSAREPVSPDADANGEVTGEALPPVNSVAAANALPTPPPEEAPPEQAHTEQAQPEQARTEQARTEQARTEQAQPREPRASNPESSVPVDSDSQLVEQEPPVS